MESRIKRILVDILDIKEEEITEGFGPSDAGGWDSMNNLRLVTALEEEFDLQLTMNEIHQMGTFAKIVEVIGQHLSMRKSNGRSQLDASATPLDVRARML